MNTWTIRSKFVKAQVQSLGAMLGPAWFKVGDITIQPFAVAPWAKDFGVRYEELPGILKRLRGEWPCVPFGIERELASLPRDWRPDGGEEALESLPHGRSSNEEWRSVGQLRDRVYLEIAYPEPHPVSLLKRTISASAIRPELNISLTVEVREPCNLPIGVHPTFRLPEKSRQAILAMDPAARAWTSPIPLEPQIARFRSDVRGVPLDRVPLVNGSDENITRLPLPYAAEEIVLTTGHSGRVALRNLDELYTVTLSWDSAVFPACQLWLSNRGRSQYPWNSRFQAVGIEPICAAFDLGTRVSRCRGNPLWRAGLPCTISLSPTEPFTTSYGIAVS